ncbi:MAG: nucleotide disphospho-sugar-binding domain-containing protein [Nocardioides sp.]
MKVTILASGSRGDVQPLVALGTGLSRAGYDVTLAAPRNFAPLVAAHGLRFHGFSVDTDELVRSELGRSWLGHSSHSPTREMRLLRALVTEWATPMARESWELVGTADLFISGVMTVDVVAQLAAAGGGAHVCALLAPFHPTADGRLGVQAPLPNRVSPLNRWAGDALTWGLDRAFGPPGAALRSLTGGDPVLGSYRRALLSAPVLLGASPLVVPRPKDWPARVEVTGYWTLPPAPGWTPNEELVRFLDEGEIPVYLGFGSMSTHDSAGTWSTIVEGLGGRRAVVHSGGADLADAAQRHGLPDNICLAGDVPHEWLFARVRAVLHHGGAGTTAAALRAGVPSVAIPHIGDQPFWGRRIHQLGVGPAPLRRHRLTSASLAALLAELETGPYRSPARALEERLRGEDGITAAVGLIDRFLPGTHPNPSRRKRGASGDHGQDDGRSR